MSPEQPNPAPQTISANPHALNPICGECGYDLRGLPADGNCPECGAAYSSDVIILGGWGAGQRESLANAAPDRLMKVGLSLSVVVIFYAFIMLRRRRSLVLAIFACVVLIQVWRRWRLTAGSGVTCHARLSAGGFGQRDGFGPINLNSWFNLQDIKLLPTGGKRHRLQIDSMMPSTHIVSIDFDCTPSQAEYLNEAITRFRRQADIARLS